MKRWKIVKNLVGKNKKTFSDGRLFIFKPSSRWKYHCQYTEYLFLNRYMPLQISVCRFCHILKENMFMLDTLCWRMRTVMKLGSLVSNLHACHISRLILKCWVSLHIFCIPPTARILEQTGFVCMQLCHLEIGIDNYGTDNASGNTRPQRLSYLQTRSLLYQILDGSYLLQLSPFSYETVSIIQELLPLKFNSLPDVTRFSLIS